MTVPKSPPGFRRRLLRAQRVGRLVLLVFVLAGAAGLFGGLGPLSGQRVVVGEQGLLSLPRFVRLQTPFVLIAENSGGDERAWTVLLSDRMVRHLSIEQIAPTPLESTWSGEGLELRFGPGTTRASVRARSDAVGPIDGHVRMDDGEPVSIPLWTYP